MKQFCVKGNRKLVMSMSSFSFQRQSPDCCPLIDKAIVVSPSSLVKVSIKPGGLATDFGLGPMKNGEKN